MLCALALATTACNESDVGTAGTTTTVADAETTTSEAPETSTTAVATTTTTTTPVAARTIIIGTTQPVSSLDSADAYSAADWELIKSFNEPLLRFQPGSDSVLEPGIADLPEISDDGLTYTLTLHSGLVFGDGTELTAEMAAQQLNRLLNEDLQADAPNQVGLALASPYVESIEAVSDTQIAFHLLAPAAFFPQLLAGAPYTVANPNIFPPDEVNLLPEGEITGLGPWTIVSNIPGEQTVLEPNANYTGNYAAQTGQVIIRRFSTSTALAEAARSGNIDIAWGTLGTEAASELKTVDGLVVATVPQTSIRYLIVNHADGFVTSDPLVRQALATAIDRDELSDVAFDGAAIPLLSPIPPGFLGATEAFTDAYPAPNVDMARDLLTQAGYSEDDKLQLDLGYPPEHLGAATADGVLQIAQQWEATGMIDVNLIAQEWDVYDADCTTGVAYDVCVLGSSLDFPDAEACLQPFIAGNGFGTMVSCPNDACADVTASGIDPALGELLQQQRTATDEAERAAVLEQLQNVYADEVVTIPLWLEPEFIVYREGIAGDDSLPNPETLNIGPDFEFLYSVLTAN